MPSWVLVIIIAVSGTIVVLGNIYYPVLRENEKKSQLSNSAVDLLKPEIEFNKKYALQLKSFVSPKQTKVEKFKVGAWETVSKGSLINGLDANTTKRLLEIYRLIYELNENNAGLIDALIGMRSVVGNAETIIPVLHNRIKADLDNLLLNIAELSDEKPSFDDKLSKKAVINTSNSPTPPPGQSPAQTPPVAPR